MPVVIQPRLLVMVRPRQPDRRVHALRGVLLQHIAPGAQLGGPGHLAGLICQGNWCAKMVAVVMEDGDARLLRFCLFLQLGLHACRARAWCPRSVRPEIGSRITRPSAFERLLAHYNS